MKGFGEIQVAVTGGLALLQQLADSSPVVPLVFCAYLFWIRLHDVRHSYATAALAAGVPVKVVSARIGHSTTQITMDLYMHALPRMDQEAADRIAAVIDG
jgi:integrase